ncbi:MAG: M14 family zinc carboxypeptidase [Kiritimatiellae bacterium]|nr:M14 family zinc carboxypeptidase [Kiritimatiellia bacterium]
MKRWRACIIVVVSWFIGVQGTYSATLWFRPVDGYDWSNPSNWLTGADLFVNRLPQSNDAVLLSSSRIQGDTPLTVAGGVTAVCQRLTVGELYNAGSHPMIRVEAGGTIHCASTSQSDTICIGDNGSGTLLLRGGTLTFGNTLSMHRNLQICKNVGATGVLRGWGTVNPAPNVTNVRMDNNGVVIADGEGLARDLDLHGIVSTTNTLAQSTETINGWYAINQGRLLFPRTWINGSATPDVTRCLGDATVKPYPEMVNSLSASFTGVNPSGAGIFFRGGVYATNHPAVPALPKGRCVGIWGLGLYANNTGWGISDLTTFSRVGLTFRYDATLVTSADILTLYRYANSAWIPVGIAAARSPYRITTSNSLTRLTSGSLNIGFFAAMASTNQGTIVKLNGPPPPDPNEKLVIDKALPAGNIRLERIEGDTVYLQNELRDTSGWWFYWAFRIQGAAGRTLTFRFTNGDAVCTRGPCVSLDQGKNWAYAAESFTTRTFTYAFPAGCDELWFAMGMVHTQRDWEAFLAKHAANTAFIETGTLCLSRKGRPVERARFGCINQVPTYRIWLSARHHAAEMMGSYVLEGILDAVLASTELGAWLRENVEFMVVPFVDKDGVEDGDQGKNRTPHDHNRDYDEFLYPECRAITNWITTHAQSDVDIVLDIHCPWIRGQYNEWVYQVYTKNSSNAAAQRRFGEILEARQRGAMNYKVTNDLPFGQSWNTDANYSAGRSFKMWVLDCVPGNRLSTTYEVPFATANSATVTREACREFGEGTAEALKAFLIETDNQAQP